MASTGASEGRKAVHGSGDVKRSAGSRTAVDVGGDIKLSGGSRTAVHRRGDIVLRETGPWTPAVHALLRHLESEGFAAAPRLVGSGIDVDGREVLTYIEGEFVQPGPWTVDGAVALGSMLRDLHQATNTFRPEPDAVWYPWHGRHLGA
ncbi:MAG: aminoglycoside phosphotransferase family protein, partial [Nocardiopsaceae bacterium]|nr:aminoglycoside phosphotransferase family protein [Nocardiopsaceae bacterium]